MHLAMLGMQLLQQGGPGQGLSQQQLIGSLVGWLILCIVFMPSLQQSAPLLQDIHMLSTTCEVETRIGHLVSEGRLYQNPDKYPPQQHFSTRGGKLVYM